MATERLTIVISENGSRVVRRSIEAIGDASNKVARDIRVLQDAIFVLGAAGLVRGLIRQLDTLSDYENRLRLTASSAQNLQEVQTALFDVARRSRTEFESVAEIYSRTALSVRELGVSQAETLRFTESLAKATIISGANAREANAALVQLAQGLASDRLSGDELRSVLEQLPFVADVIAKSIGATRGELRKLGADGKITAEIVLNAFRNAEQEIDTLFSQTTPTIAQAFTVAKVNFQEFLDTFDDASGFSAAIAKGIVVLSQNIDELVNALSLLAGALTATFTARVIASVFNYVNGIRQSILATRAATAADIQRKGAIAGVLAARQATTSQNVIALAQERALLRSKLQTLALEAKESQFIVKNGVARNAASGQFTSLAAATTRYNVAQANLNRTQFALLNTERALAVERGRLTGVTNAATVASGRYAAAQAASTAGLARFGLLGRGLQGILRGVGIALSGVIALLGGPITAAIAAVGLLTVAFIRWGNAIEVETSSGLAGLRDIAQSTFQVITDRLGDAVAAVGEFIKIPQAVKDAFSPLAGIADISMGDVVSAVGRGIRIVIDTFLLPVNVFLGVVSAIVAAANTLPGNFAAIFGEISNLVIRILVEMANKAIRIINSIAAPLNALAGTSVGDALGIPEGGVKILDEIIPPPAATTGAFQSVGAAAAEGFRSGFGATGRFLDGLGADITAGAVALGENRRSDAALIKLAADREALLNGTGTGTGDGTSPGGGGGGGGRNKRTFEFEIQQLRDLVDIERQYGIVKQQNEEIIRIEEALKRQLSDTEQDLVRSLVSQVEISKIQGQVLEDILGPAEKLQLTQVALNELFDAGTISLGQFNDKLRETYIAAQQAAGTLAGGFKSAIAGSIQGATEFGAALGNVVVGGIDSAADAIVEFAKTGRANLRQLFQDFFAQLLKLAAQRLLLQFLGGFLGIPGGGIAGAIGGGGVIGFSTGGSILPSGPGRTDSQLVQFAKRPDERVDVLTPAQQRAQAEQMARGNQPSQQVVQPSMNVAVVLSEDDIINALGSDKGDTFIVRAVERNKDSVRQVVSG